MPSIHGPNSTSTTNIASSLGMNDSVISLIWVAAWNTLTTSPVISAAKSGGPDSSKVTSSALCASVSTLSGVISCASPKIAGSGVETLDQRPDQQVPAVGEHEQHDLEWQ